MFFSSAKRPTSQVCFYDHELFGSLSFDDHCAAVFAALKEFCRKNSLQLHMVNITRQLLGYPKSSEYPTGFFSCMGSNIVFFFTPFTLKNFGEMLVYYH